MENCEDDYNDCINCDALITVNTDDLMFVDELIAEETDSKRKGKVIEYFSSKLCVLTFTHEVGEKKYVIFQLYNRDTEESIYSWISNDKLLQSHLMNLINRAENQNGTYTKNH